MAERTEVNAGSSTALGADGGLPPRRSKPSAPSRESAASGGGSTPRGGGKPKAAKKRSWRETRTGRVLELLVYLIMLVLALVYFTGKGLFIYEGF